MRLDITMNIKMYWYLWIRSRNLCVGGGVGEEKAIHRQWKRRAERRFKGHKEFRRGQVGHRMNVSVDPLGIMITCLGSLPPPSVSQLSTWGGGGGGGGTC